MEAVVSPSPRLKPTRPDLAPGADLGLRARSRPRAVVLTLAISVALFLLAWLPRAQVIDDFLTTDEGNWMGRTSLFARGLTTGDPGLTYQSGHPGVTTMWTALAGLGLEKALFLADYVRPDGLEKAPGYLDLLRQARRPFTILTSLAVVAICLLTWRLFGLGPGLIAGVLLALEPFFLAHSGVVHLDGMLSSYMTVAVLSALVYWGRGGGWGYLLLCGLSTGLAFLTKTPSSLLALFIPAFAILATRLRGGLRSRADWQRLVLQGAVWGLLAGGLSLLLWPSLRADFVGTLRNMIDYTEVVGGSDHENFFRGQPVGDPGPLYYVVALGFRATPVTMLGVALLLLMLLPIGRRRVPRHWLGLLAGLFAFMALFTLMMMQPPKKFDRYLLPTFPGWEILAALGFWLALRQLPARWSARALPGLLLAVGLGHALLAFQVYPYFLSYYNPLLGGGKAAAKNLVVGWGEGLDQVTSYLNTKPDAERLTISGFYPRVLMAQFKGDVLPDKQYDPARTDYIVLYVNAVQRDLANSLRTATRGRRPEQVVTINGAEYAWVYRVPPGPENVAGTEFGPLRLDRFYLRSDERRYLKSDELIAGDTMLLTLRWTVLKPVQSAYLATVALVDEQGRVLAETTDQIGGSDESTTSVRAGDFLTEVHQLPIPAEAEGEFRVVLSVRPTATGPAEHVLAWPDRMDPAQRLSATQIVLDGLRIKAPPPS